MKHIVLQLCILCSLAIYGQETKMYETEIYLSRVALFNSEVLEKNQIVFFGNSLTQGGKWNEYFPKEKIVNRGIIGDNTDGALARLDKVIEAQPSKFFFLSGVNDISQGYNNDYICKNMKEIIHRIKKGSPQTVIYFQSLLPVNNSFERYKKLINKEKQIEKLNKQIEKLCKSEGIHYINLYTSFLAKKRLLNPIYTTDGLHLNEDGYIIWIDLIREFVENN